MKRMTVLVLAFLTVIAPVLAQEPQVPEPTQRTDATYRMFRTQNIYTLFTLDTRTGKVWQVQWGNDTGYRWVVPINLKPLADGRAGRFTLYPTPNMYTFILLDQEDGRTWQAQWGKEEGYRFVVSIP